MNNKYKRQTELTLPSAKGKISNRLIWNLYREFGKNTHYYHISPFNYKDKLIKQNINPSEAIDLIEKYNAK